MHGISLVSPCTTLPPSPHHSSCQVTWEVNKRWLVRVPCFMFVDDKTFLVRIARATQTVVYVPNERPPARRLYLLEKVRTPCFSLPFLTAHFLLPNAYFLLVTWQGTAFYKGRSLGPGDVWGAEDVLLAHQTDGARRQAFTTSYVHAIWVRANVFDELTFTHTHTH